MPETPLPAGTKKLLTALIESPWEKLSELRADAAEARAIQQFLHGFLIFHLGKIPKGRGALLQ